LSPTRIPAHDAADVLSTTLSNHPWQRIFALPPSRTAVKWERSFLFRKGGQPWLLLPAAGTPASRGLDLYPAQTAKARLAKTVLRLALRCGWFPRAETITIARTRANAWEGFLQQLSGGLDFPTVASLAGHPAAAGQRLIFLVFNEQQHPQWVVKVGISGTSAALIEHESKVLKSLPAQLAGLPARLGDFAQGELRAFAMDYCAGVAPSPKAAAKLSTLLNQWIDPQREMPLLELPAVQELAKALASAPWFNSWRQRVASLRVRPVVMHGDFAPWNIKESPQTGAWTVLDWERGAVTGVPGWDWFHFVLQPEILVRRQPAAAVAARARALLQSAAFQSYARATGISGHEPAVLLAYLAHAAEVIRPAEGLEVTRQVLEEFCA
jgi:hypothetical protein